MSPGLLIAAALAARSPEQRQALADLAYTLGQSHALAQACGGAAEQGWRTRMGRLLDVEGAGAPLRAQLTERFNAGFAAARTEHPGCDAAVAPAARAAADRGARLAQMLATRTP